MARTWSTCSRSTGTTSTSPCCPKVIQGEASGRGYSSPEWTSHLCHRELMMWYPSPVNGARSCDTSLQSILHLPPHPPAVTVQNCRHVRLFIGLTHREVTWPDWSHASDSVSSCC